jgi:hypothetical protein
MSLLKHITGKGNPAEGPKSTLFLPFGLLAGAVLPEENWLRAELAMPAHKFRQAGPEKIGQAVRQLSARAAAGPPGEELDQMNSLLDLLAPIRISKCKTENQTMSFNLAGLRDGVETDFGFATVALMPVPIPGTEVEEACGRSWRWPEAAETVRQQTNHWVVGLVTNATPFQNAALGLRLLGALSSLPEFLGAYIGPAGMVHSPAFLQAWDEGDTSTSRVNYWVNMGTVANDDGTHTFYTMGLRQFNALEIEIVQCRLPYEELYKRGRTYAEYVMRAGPVLRHGDSLGETATEKIPVRHEPSVYNPEQTVCRIYL